MTISSAYIFAKQIKAGTPPPEPITLFENGTWNTEILGQYWRAGGVYGPIAPGVFTTCRQQAMAEYGYYAYHNVTNLVALGNKYNNLYSMDTTNITRDCHTGASIDQCGLSEFIPLVSLVDPISQINVEYKITNTHSETYEYTHLKIGAIRLNENAYETIVEETGTEKGDWNTLTVTLPSAQVIDAIEIQSAYGIYEIKKIIFQ